MEYQFVPMNEQYAREIAYSWKYDGIYSFYNITADEEDLAEFLDPGHWEYVFAVLNLAGELSGYYSYSFENGVMWVGFGMKPELTGQGAGPEYILAGIEFGIRYYKYDKDHIMLAVARFNKRAIKAYKKIGFEKTAEYLQETNGGQYEFIKMRKDI